MGDEIAWVILVAVAFLVIAVAFAAYLPLGVVAILSIVGIVFLVISAVAILSG